MLTVNTLSRETIFGKTVAKYSSVTKHGYYLFFSKVKVSPGSRNYEMPPRVHFHCASILKCNAVMLTGCVLSEKRIQ